MANWLKWVLGAIGLGGAAYGANEIHKHKHFNKDGYNRLGRDRDGRDRDGYDINGYDREGRDREGYDGYGRDREGRDRGGFDKDGRNREGYDRNGYDILGYKKDGKDRVEKTREDYQSLIEEIDSLIIEGKAKLDAHQYRFAIAAFRPGLENGIKALLEHRIGKQYTHKYGSTLVGFRPGFENRVKALPIHWIDSSSDNQSGDFCNNINRCKQNGIIDEEFAKKLHQARIHCKATHDLAIDKEHNQIFFCYRTLQELRSLLIKDTLG